MVEAAPQTFASQVLPAKGASPRKPVLNLTPPSTSSLFTQGRALHLARCSSLKPKGWLNIGFSKSCRCPPQPHQRLECSQDETRH